MLSETRLLLYRSCYCGKTMVNYRLVREALCRMKPCSSVCISVCGGGGRAGAAAV